MPPSPSTPDWDQLLALLEPVHAPCRLFARRIAGSNADGDDLFHEALLRAAAKLHTLRDPKRFRPWLHQVIVSVHRSHYRRSFWRRLVPRDARTDDSGPGPLDDGHGASLDGHPGGADGWVNQRASADRAARALATLPPAQREAIVLFELFGYGVDEVADIQRCSVSAVKSRLSRGRARLRRFYAAQEDLLPAGSSRPLPIQEECRG